MDEEAVALVGISGPAHLQHQRGAGLQPQEGGQEILHVERGDASLELEAPAGEEAPSTGPQRGVGGGADGDHPGVAHQPQRQVEHVHPQVDQTAAARPGLVGEPTASAGGDTLIAQPAGSDEVDLPQIPGLDVTLEDLTVVLEAAVEDGHQHPACTRGRLGHGLPLGDADGQGFLDQHVFPGL